MTEITGCFLVVFAALAVFALAGIGRELREIRETLKEFLKRGQGSNRSERTQ